MIRLTREQCAELAALDADDLFIDGDALTLGTLTVHRFDTEAAGTVEIPPAGGVREVAA